MAELNFTVDQTALDVVRNTVIEANFEEVKAALTEITAPYKNMIVSEDAIDLAKKDRAKIRKVSDNIDSYRKTIKKIYTEPLSVFEDKCKKLTGICKEASDNLDTQVKKFEEKRKQDKFNELESHFNALPKTYSEYVTYGTVFNERWGNVGYKIEDAKKEIEDYVNRVDTEVASIKVMGAEFVPELLLYYKAGHSLGEVVSHMNELKTMKETKERQERERIAREQERARIQAETEECIRREVVVRQVQQYEPIPQVDDDVESDLNNIRRTVVPARVQETDGTELHTVNIWVQGTREQLANLSELLHQAGVTYGAL